MSDLSALPSDIVGWLSEREDLEYIKFLTEFPPIKKAVPLKKTTVAVGIKEMQIVDAFTENDEGVLERNEFCRNAKITLRLSIHAPYSAGGSACHDAFTDIIDCLTFDSGLYIITSGCDGITSDRDTDAFVLTAWAQIEANLCPAAATELNFPSFLDKDLLCGSHIRNTEIHVSPEQLEFLNSPFETGSYFGTGTASQTINLGFQPRMVFVGQLGAPMIKIDYDNHTAKSTGAVSTRSYASLGLEITESGFRINNSDTPYGGVSPLMNEPGKTYFYFVVR